MTNESIKTETAKTEGAAQYASSVCTSKPTVFTGTLPTGPVGWICPRCGRGNSPWTAQCPCAPEPEMRITC